MKNILSLILCASFVLSVTAQDRRISPRRTAQAPPVLLTMAGSDDAAGFAQTPQGYALPLYASPVPAESHVGIYGRSLSASTFSVMLWHSGGVAFALAESSRNPFPGLETVSFRLPADARGEVWVTVIGRQSSNTVRLVVG